MLPVFSGRSHWVCFVLVGIYLTMFNRNYFEQYALFNWFHVVSVNELYWARTGLESGKSVQFWIKFGMIIGLLSQTDRRQIFFFVLYKALWNAYKDFLFFNSLWCGDATWCDGPWSTLVKVMAWCLTAPSHHLNHCWFIVSNTHKSTTRQNMIRYINLIHKYYPKLCFWKYQN